MKSTQRPAFTLVELLVVVGIIAILVAILMPVLGAVRRRAAAVNCMSNLRQWGLAARMYAQDHGDYLPREKAEKDPAAKWSVDVDQTWEYVSHEVNLGVWYNVLARRHLRQRGLGDYAADPAARPEFYSHGRGNLFHCPGADVDFSGPLAEHPRLSLAMNAKLVQDGRLAKLTQMRRSANTPLFVDGGLPGEVGVPGQKAYEGRPHVTAERVSFRHSGRANFVMADGHCEDRPVTDVFDARIKGAFYPQIHVVWTLDPQQDPNANPQPNPKK